MEAAWTIRLAQNQIICALKEKFEQVKDIWLFIKLFHDWQAHHKHATERLETLKRKIEALRSLEADINEELKLEEFQTGKKPKREVKAWLNRIEMVKRDFSTLERKAVKKESYFGILVEDRIEANLRKVDELREQSKFPNGLTLYDEPSVTPELIGHNVYVEKVMELLNDSSVTKIGVYGPKGVGKTRILKYIQAKLSQNTSTMFEHVYWVSVPKQPSIHKLQDDIAKQVGVDLSDEEDKILRAAKIQRYLTKRGKCLIVLDGVGGKLTMEGVGIKPCKLVVSGSSEMDCSKLGCNPNIEIKPLSDETALKLFETVSSPLKTPLGPAFKEVSKRIVEECRGLPRNLITLATRLSGVDDIDEWRHALNEIKASRTGPVD